MKEIITHAGETVTLTPASDAILLFAGLTMGVPGQVVLTPKDAMTVAIELVVGAIERNGYRLFREHMEANLERLEEAATRFKDAHGGEDDELDQTPPVSIDVAILPEGGEVEELIGALETLPSLAPADGTPTFHVAMTAAVRDLIVSTLRYFEAYLTPSIVLSKADQAAEYDSGINLAAIAEAIGVILPIVLEDGREVVYVPMGVEVRDLLVRVLEGDAAMNDVINGGDNPPADPAGEATPPVEAAAEAPASSAKKPRQKKAAAA